MQINIAPGQSIGWAIKKLKKKLEDDGFFEDLRRRQYFMTKSQKRRLKHKLAVRRQRKELGYDEPRK